jgi:hypothetical protein
MPRPPRAAIAFALPFAAASGIGGSARAEVSKDACLAAYEDAQLARRDGKLTRAMDHLRVCANAECSRPVRVDCVAWLGEVERSIPTVVFEAHTETGDVSDVRVLVDDHALATRIDGKAIAVDPGPHVFRFELEGHAPIEQSVILLEGQKNRPLRATWTGPKDLTAPAPATPAPATPEPGPRERPIPARVYVLGGVGLAGLTAFGAFAIAGASKKAALKDSCAPFCTSSDVAPAKTAFALADVSLGVGIVALGTAMVLYFARPEGSPRASAIVIDAGPRGGAVGWMRAF